MICDLCDDDGTDWTDGAYHYHRACIEARIAAPRNNRERDGLTNSLRLGRSTAPAVASETYTVKQADIFGNVIDTYQTEGELNGWRAKQGLLL